MKATEFFNLFPEEMNLIDKHYKQKMSFEKISTDTGQNTMILERTNNTLLLKLTNGFRHCGVKMTCAGMRKMLRTGVIEIKEE